MSKRKTAATTPTLYREQAVQRHWSYFINDELLACLEGTPGWLRRTATPEIAWQRASGRELWEVLDWSGDLYYDPPLQALWERYRSYYGDKRNYTTFKRAVRKLYPHFGPPRLVAALHAWMKRGRAVNKA